MKLNILKSARRSLLYGIFFIGMAYSMLALSAKPMYAASCNCSEELAEALAYCSPLGGILQWVCPDGDYAVAHCRNGAIFVEYCPNT